MWGGRQPSGKREQREGGGDGLCSDGRGQGRTTPQASERHDGGNGSDAAMATVGGMSR